MRSICSVLAVVLSVLIAAPRSRLAGGSDGSAPQPHIAEQHALDAAVSHMRGGRSGSGDRSIVPPARGCQGDCR